jgi:hypothetical protein
LYQNAIDTMSDKSIPSDEAWEATDTVLKVMSGSAHNKEMFYQAIIEPLSKNLSGDYLPWYLKGSHEIEMAWAARGSGYADTVTKEGWVQFGKDLAAAREDFERAWKLNPKQAKIATQMLTVVLGQGSDRKEMELWFNRAMELDTNNYRACWSKENYLEARWYGSDEEAVVFGKECVQSSQWGGQIPLILVRAHNVIASQLSGIAKRDYWKQPEVWADIKSAYDRYFELNPEETSTYNDYVFNAYRAEQWEVVNQLIPKLTTTNYTVFGGKSRFDEMMVLAGLHK